MIKNAVLTVLAIVAFSYFYQNHDVNSILKKLGDDAGGEIKELADQTIRRNQ